jgi:hypothetical protein
MCFFQQVTVELYPAEPGLKGDYYQPGETEEQYRSRMMARHRERCKNHREANAAAKSGTLQLIGKVAEH